MSCTYCLWTDEEAARTSAQCLDQRSAQHRPYRLLLTDGGLRGGWWRPEEAWARPLGPPTAPGADRERCWHRTLVRGVASLERRLFVERVGLVERWAAIAFRASCQRNVLTTNDLLASSHALLTNSNLE